MRGLFGLVLLLVVSCVCGQNSSLCAYRGVALNKTLGQPGGATPCAMAASVSDTQGLQNAMICGEGYSVRATVWASSDNPFAVRFFGTIDDANSYFACRVNNNQVAFANVATAPQTYCLNQVFVSNNNASVIVFECLLATGGCQIRYTLDQDCAFYGSAYLMPLSAAAIALAGLLLCVNVGVMIYAFTFSYLLKKHAAWSLVLTSVASALFLAFWVLFYLLTITDITAVSAKYVNRLSVATNVVIMVSCLLHLIVQMIMLHQWLRAVLAHHSEKWKRLSTVVIVVVASIICVLKIVYISVLVASVLEFKQMITFNIIFISLIYSLYFVVLAAQLTIGMIIVWRAPKDVLFSSKTVRIGLLLLVLAIFYFLRFIAVLIYVNNISSHLQEGSEQYFPAWLYIGKAGSGPELALFYHIATYLFANMMPTFVMLFVLYWSIAMERKREEMLSSMGWSSDTTVNSSANLLNNSKDKYDV